MTTPAGRYIVVERDRRLITIDTLSGQEIGGMGAAPVMQPVTPPPPPPLPVTAPVKAVLSPWAKRS